MAQFKRIYFIPLGLLLLMPINVKTFAVTDYSFIQKDWVGNEAELNLPLPERKGLLTGIFSATDANRDNMLTYQAGGAGNEISSFSLTYVEDSEAGDFGERSIGSFIADLMDLVSFKWTLGKAFGQTSSDEISVSLFPFYEELSYSANSSTGFIIDDYQTNNAARTASPLIISSVPEVDAAGAPLALALLAGIYVVFRARYHRQA